MTSVLKPNINIKLSLLSVMILFLGFHLSGCQHSAIEVHHTTDQTFSSYKTFNIESITPSDAPVMDHIISAIETTLTQKGYKLSKNADLTLLFGIRLKSDQSLKINQIPYKGNIATQPSMEAVYTASLLVNAIDNKNKRVVWKALTTKDLTQQDTSRLNLDRLRNNIQEVFESLPRAHARAQ